ncbi:MULTISPECIES: DUF6708 domain-containing protein [Photorhabdus]|uniref:DUF6708 domain-containing protein n=1 Tax=Photorhabdus TaxID=29487 RepID=UPI001BD6151B|nr:MULTISPECIES: DUF6708 domain-containing protein [Photorhabdus]MBS9435505.1 hypothetical protein [Photorhabdus hainanensis]MCC8457439.1 hypothetical protein [Photorhabdus aegyptia]
MQVKGLYIPYELNRPLMWEEKENQLHQGKPTQITSKYSQYITDHDTVIRMNSTYMETVDKYYRERGFVSAFSATFFFCCLGIGLFAIGCMIYQYIKGDHEALVSLLIILLVISPTLYFISKFIRKEWFATTHYPIRFNRKTQMIYVYRFNGSVLSAPWKEVFFTLTEAIDKRREWSVDGHILADDQETVLETFSLGLSGWGKDIIQGYWEFIRCYMEEECLQEQADIIALCPPIEKQKESYIFGLQYLMRMNSRLGWIFGIIKLPFALIASIARYIAGQTSKMPQWPQEVEEDCQVDPDDPINVSAANNPVHLWRYVLASQTREERQVLHNRKSSARTCLQEKIVKKYGITSEGEGKRNVSNLLKILQKLVKATSAKKQERLLFDFRSELENYYIWLEEAVKEGKIGYMMLNPEQPDDLPSLFVYLSQRQNERPDLISGVDRPGSIFKEYDSDYLYTLAYTQDCDFKFVLVDENNNIELLSKNILILLDLFRNSDSEGIQDQPTRIPESRIVTSGSLSGFKRGCIVFLGALLLLVFIFVMLKVR